MRADSGPLARGSWSCAGVADPARSAGTTCPRPWRAHLALAPGEPSAKSLLDQKSAAKSASGELADALYLVPQTSPTQQASGWPFAFNHSVNGCNCLASSRRRCSAAWTHSTPDRFRRYAPARFLGLLPPTGVVRFVMIWQAGAALLACVLGSVLQLIRTPG